MSAKTGKWCFVCRAGYRDWAVHRSSEGHVRAVKEWERVR